MASVRKKGNYYYYRVSIREGKKIKYIEHGGFPTYEAAKSAGERDYPSKRKVSKLQITDHLVDVIFERFPETTTAYLPLYLVLYASIPINDVYRIKVSDIDFASRTLHGNSSDIRISNSLRKFLNRYLEKVVDGASIYRYANEENLITINLLTGKRIHPNQQYYISKVIQRTINPDWTWERWQHYYS